MPIHRSFRMPRKMARKTIAPPRLLLPLALPLMLLLAACAEEARDLTQETPRPDEAEQAEAGKRHFEKLLDDYRADYVARGAHAKAHACVRAYFEIDEEAATRLRHGVFATPGKRYRAWIRLSNGHYDLNSSQDYRNDARGMAIKLLQIDGEPLETDDTGAHSQDFLLTSSPVFFARTMHDYNELVAAPRDLRGFFFPGWNPFRWRWKELLAVPKTLTPPPASVLDPDYYSITPYKLGPRNVKYGARPCPGRTANAVPPHEQDQADFLQRQLARELRERGACFYFAAQEQKPERGMDLDDATAVWSEKDSPFLRLATITIPAQSFLRPEQMAFCENLSFAPWHALPAHRPIGELNRLRRHVYPASSRHRRARNETRVPAALAFWCAAPGFSCDNL